MRSDAETRKCVQKSANANASLQKSANASPQKSANASPQKSIRVKIVNKLPRLKQPGLITPKSDCLSAKVTQNSEMPVVHNSFCSQFLESLFAVLAEC